MFRKNIGIDIGTTQISICTAEDGLLLKEPSVAAVMLDTDEVVEAGTAALQMVEAHPDKYRLCWPVWDPVVKCAEILSAMLRLLLRRAIGRTAWKPQIMLSIPCDLTEAQANAVEDAALAAGAAKAHLLEAPICAALGAGVDFSAPVGRMIVHMGASRTEIAVIFIGEMVAHITVPTGGAQFDSAIIQHLRSKHKLLIGKKTAEQIKIRLLTVKDQETRTLNVKGRCMETKEPRIVTLSSREMLGAISETLAEVMDGIVTTLDHIGDDMRADIVKEGILLTGAGVLNGFDWFLNQLFKVRVQIADNAAIAAVEGAALALSRL